MINEDMQSYTLHICSQGEDQTGITDTDTTARVKKKCATKGVSGKHRTIERSLNGVAVQYVLSVDRSMFIHRHPVHRGCLATSLNALPTPPSQLHTPLPSSLYQ